MRLPLIVGAMAVAGVALAAPPAGAALHTETEYDVTVEGRYRYAVERTTPLADGSRTEAFGGTVTTRAVVAHVLFRDGRLVRSGQWALAGSEQTGSGTVSETHRTAEGPVTRTRGCTVDVPLPPGRAEVVGRGRAPGGGETVSVRLAETPSLTLLCGGEAIGEVLGPLQPTDVGAGPFDATFDLPGEATVMGRTIQLVRALPAQRSPASCPSSTGTADRCELDWDGTVTLDRVRQDTWDDSAGEEALLAPLVPPTPVPVDDGDLLAPLVPPGDADLLAPLVPARAARASARGDRIALRLRCPAGCAGRAVLQLGRAAPRARRGRVAGAAMRFRLPPGQRTRTVRLAVPKARRAALRRARSAQLRVTVTPRGGRAVTGVRAVRVARR